MSNQQRVLLFTYGGIAAAVAVLCVAAIIVFSSFSDEPETAQAEESVSTEVSYEEPEAETADAAAAPNYTVKALPDGIGVFDAFGTLIRSFPVEVSTLPAADQNALQRGIDVTGKESLDKLLQDLTS